MIESIRYRRDFDVLRETGRFRRSGPLGLRCAIDDDSDRVRMAFAIPRTVGNAVTRNRVRRRLRAIARDLDGNGVLASGSYLVQVSPAGSTSSFDELRTHLTTLVRELR